MRNLVRQKLFSGEVSLGTFITLGVPDVTDILKTLGFDWFVFDTEHTYLSTKDVQLLLHALGGENVSSLVRIGEVNPYLVKRALDIGSQGILAPWLIQPKKLRIWSSMRCILP